MFFVSHKSSSYVFITDTEDGVEEKMPYKEAIEAVCMGIPIEGIKMTEDKHWLVDIARPCEMSTRETKAMVIDGVDIRVVDGVVQNFRPVTAMYLME